MPLSALYDARILLDEETSISPTLGLFFKGCDLWCRFCMDHEYAWTRSEDWPVDRAEFQRLLDKILRVQEACHLRTISLVGGEPSQRRHDVGEALLEFGANTEACGQGRRIPPLVLNSNMLFPPGEGPESWGGIVSWFVADLKFGNDTCAERLTLPGAPARNGQRLGYLGRVKENILAAQEVGNLIVRHLVMPGHLRCCTEPVLKWVRDELPDVDVHLMLDYYPNGRSRLRELERMLSAGEKREAQAIAREYGVKLCSTGAGELKREELMALADLESRMHQVFQGAGCTFRWQTVWVTSDGSVMVPDLSANMEGLLRARTWGKRGHSGT